MTTGTDKLVEMALEFGATRGQLTNTLIVTAPMLKDLLDAHIASLCGDVEPVARMDRHGVPRPLLPSEDAKNPLYSASTVAALKARVAELEKDAARATDWWRLYDRAINEANGLTNYVEDRPELRRAERRLDVITADARALKGQQ